MSKKTLMERWGNKRIQSVEEAKQFLQDIQGYNWHPDDNAFGLMTAEGELAFTFYEAAQLSLRMDEVWIQLDDPYIFVLEMETEND